MAEDSSGSDWLLATPKPGHVQTPQVLHRGMAAQGAGGCPGPTSGVEGWSPGWGDPQAWPGRKGGRGGLVPEPRTQKHGHSCRCFSPPAGATPAGSGRPSERCGDCLGWSRVTDGTHFSRPTPPLTPVGAQREPSGPLAASGPRSSQTPLGPPSRGRRAPAWPRTQSRWPESPARARKPWTRASAHARRGGAEPRARALTDVARSAPPPRVPAAGACPRV